MEWGRAKDSRFGRLVLWCLALGFAAVSVAVWSFEMPWFADAQNPFNDWTSNNTTGLLTLYSFWLITNGAAAFALPLLELCQCYLSTHSQPQSTAPQPAHRSQSAVLQPIWSRAAKATLLVYVVWTVLAFVLPLSYFDDYRPVTDIYWYSYVPEGTSLLSTAGAWAYAAAVVASWPALGNFFLVMILSARTNPVLTLLGLTFDESLWFHKLAGRAAVFWSTVHAMCQFPALAVDSTVYVQVMWNPTIMEGWFNFTGQVAWVISLVIVLLSLRWFRRNCYNLFRLSHYMFWLVIAWLPMHFANCFFYFQLGLVLYSADLAHRWVLKATRTNATARVHISEVGQLVELSIPIIRGCTAGSCVYLRAPAVSLWEWHPFTVSDTSDARMRVLVRCSGDWTRHIFEHVQSITVDAEQGLGKEASLCVDVEGPYDTEWTTQVVERVRGGAHVALVGGGVGLSSTEAAVHAVLAAKCDAEAMRRVHVLAVGSGREVLQCYSGSLSKVAAHGAYVSTWLTKDLMPSSSYTPVLQASKDRPSALSHDLGQNGKQDTDFTARPAAWYLRVLLSAVIVWMAAAGSTLGFMAGSKISSYGSYMPEGEELYQLQVQYNQTVAANYLALNGQPLEPNSWPEGQEPFPDPADFLNCPLMGRPNYYMHCSNVGPDAWPVGYEYGQPLPCDNLPQCWVGPFLAPEAVSIASMLVLAFATAATIARTLFRTQRPLHDDAAVRHDDNGKITPISTNVAPNFVDDIPPYAFMYGVAARMRESKGVHLYIYVCGPASMPKTVRKWVNCCKQLEGVTVKVVQISYTL